MYIERDNTLISILKMYSYLSLRSTTIPCPLIHVKGSLLEGSNLTTRGPFVNDYRRQLAPVVVIIFVQSQPVKKRSVYKFFLWA